MEFNQSPEQLPSVETSRAQHESGVERGTNVIEKIEKRVSQLERLKESQKKQGGSAHDDEDQQSALQAAKTAKKGGRFVQIQGKDVDLNVVSSHFFIQQAKKIADVVKRDLQKAVEWLADLRNAYQVFDRNPKNGKSLHSIALAVMVFWKV